MLAHLHRIRYVCIIYDARLRNSQVVKASYMMQIALEDYMTKELPEWERRVQTLLKVELTKRSLTYKQLSEKLAEIGVSESEPNIRDKLARSSFSAAFMVQCRTAMGAKEVKISDC